MDTIVDLTAGIIRLIILLAIVLAIVALVGYNKMRELAEGVKAAWSNISVATRKKIALVNQMIDLVRGYQESEKLVMLKISDDLTVQSFQQAYQQSGTVLSAISGVAQRFPDLKASGQYDHLAKSIDDSEKDLQAVRERYNESAKQYNSRRASIPHIFYADVLGFRAAPYLTLEAVESPDAGVQRPLVSDDGERVNELLGMAGSKVMGAARTLAEKGRMLAERSAAAVNEDQNAQFHYLDRSQRPKGPVSRSELFQLFRSGAITVDTDVLMVGGETWKKYREI